MKVSIIVPVYNVEIYLRKCLDSLVNQTLEDIEIIVVNDSTKDNSQSIIDEYVAKYPDKIKAYIKENGGLSDARNFGIKRATGDYIGFVDSDDYVETTMFEKLYNKAISNNLDIVMCGVKLVYEDTNVPDREINMSVLQDITSKEDLKSSATHIYPVVWNKLVKRNLIINEENFIEFKKGIWFEDVHWYLRLLPYLSNMGIVNEPLYNYLQRQNSITYTYNEKLYQLITSMEDIISYYKDKQLYDEYKEELEYLYVRYAFATFPKRLAKAKDYKKYMDGIDFALKEVNRHFPEYRKNKYLKMGLKGKYIKYFNKAISNITYLVEKNKKFN